MAGDARVVLRRMLDELTDVSAPADRSPAYRRGFDAGTRYARICVLDEIAAVSGGLDEAAMIDGMRRDRELMRVRAALRTIERRLADAAAPGAGDSATGFRDAVDIALQSISGLQPAGLSRE
ncbi:hypothetical protein [Mycolicibacterium rutilum]|uniref:hypothetical protein n=1 Tax=Mycolicibacterium rutilum TaxID=370526 RepID=UPI000B10AC0C|nr:hypothetical protein [Mycolicibacterium rutilum]